MQSNVFSPCKPKAVLQVYFLNDHSYSRTAPSPGCLPRVVQGPVLAHPPGSSPAPRLTCQTALPSPCTPEQGLSDPASLPVPPPAPPPLPGPRGRARWSRSGGGFGGGRAVSRGLRKGPGRPLWVLSSQVRQSRCAAGWTGRAAGRGARMRPRSRTPARAPTQSTLSRLHSPRRRVVRGTAGTGGQSRAGWPGPLWGAALLPLPGPQHLRAPGCPPDKSTGGHPGGGAMKIPDAGWGAMCGRKASLARRGSCPRALQSGQEDGLCPRIGEGWPGRALLSPISGANSTLLDPTGEGVVPGSGWSFGDRVFTSNTGPPAPFSVHLLGSGGRTSGHLADKLVSCAPARWDTAVRTRPHGPRACAARLRPRPTVVCVSAHLPPCDPVCEGVPSCVRGCGEAVRLCR